jgi:hypothetical protein
MHKLSQCINYTTAKNYAKVLIQTVINVNYEKLYILPKCKLCQNINYAKV